MKDNFQDRKIRTVLEIFANEILAYGKTGEAQNPKLFIDTTQTIKQLLKDYIEAQIPKLDNNSLQQSWKLGGTDQPSYERGHSQALQQYKSNLLEGLSDE